MRQKKKTVHKYPLHLLSFSFKSHHPHRPGDLAVHMAAQLEKHILYSFATRYGHILV